MSLRRHQGEKHNFQWAPSAVDHIRKTGVPPELCTCTCSCTAFCKHCRKPRRRIPVELPPHPQTDDIMKGLNSIVNKNFYRHDIDLRTARHLTRIRLDAFSVLKRTLVSGFLNGHPIMEQIRTLVESLQTSGYAKAKQAAKIMCSKYYYEGGRRGKKANKNSSGGGAERFSIWIKAMKDLVAITLATQHDNGISECKTIISTEVERGASASFGTVDSVSFVTSNNERKIASFVTANSEQNVTNLSAPSIEPTTLNATRFTMAYNKQKSAHVGAASIYTSERKPKDQVTTPQFKLVWGTLDWMEKMRPYVFKSGRH